MIDLPLYAFAIPLSLILFTATILYEVHDYDSSMDRIELTVRAHVLADKLVSSEQGLAKPVEIGREDEFKVLPNILVDRNITLSQLGFPSDWNVLVTLDNKNLFSQGTMDGEVYSVNRIVSYGGKPATLRVSVGK